MKLCFAFAAVSLLTACSNDPVDPTVSRDDSQSGGAATNAPGRANAPMIWTWSATTQSASFGPDASRPELSIECRSGVLHITRHAPVENAKGTLSFTGSRSAASVPVVAARSQLGPGSLSTTALKPGDMTNAVARVFAAKGPVQVTLGGAPSLVTLPSDVPGRAFAACRR
jgi:hypothetical protein